MKFTAAQCIERIKAPVNTQALTAARLQEERLLMHGEPMMSKANMPALERFLEWVKVMLPTEKFLKFCALVKYPLDTVDLTESIFDDLSKVFDTPDKFIRFEFSSPDIEREFMQYADEVLKDDEFWLTKGLDALKTGINSFVVVDAPPEQKTTRPEPYYYLLGIRSVYDVAINTTSGAVEYIVFWQADGSLVFIDDVAYRRFIRPKETGEWQLAPQGEKIHSRYPLSKDENSRPVWGELTEGLGYAPVCSFYRHTIKGSEGINKRGPLTNALGKYDTLLFKIISQEYYEMYGSYPVTVAYKQKCKYKDEENNECVAGYVNYYGTDPKTQLPCNMQKPCPVCATRKELMGPGTFLEVDTPADKDDVDLMENPVKFIEPSTDLLDFGVEAIERKKKEIRTNTVGTVEEATKEAINEKQVRSQYEGQKAVLNRIREQLQQSRKFALETVARLRYGRYYKRGTVNMGSEYFLQSPDDITLQYMDAKKAGLPGHAIAEIRDQYLRTKYKNSPLYAQRAFILSELEPYPDMTPSEMMANGVREVDPEGYLLKLDFVTFIKRFERENHTNIVDFGSLIDFDTKISIINKKLTEYVKRKIESAPKPRIEPGAASGAGR